MQGDFMAVNMYSKASVESFIRGAQWHAGNILGLTPDKKPAAAYRRHLEQNRETYPLTFVYQESSWNLFGHRSFNLFGSLFGSSAPAPAASQETDPKEDKKEKEKDNRALALVVGLVGSFYFAWQATKSIRSMKEWRETVANANTALSQLLQSKSDGTSENRPVISDLTNLVLNYKRVLEAEYVTTRNYAITYSTALAGAVSLVAGGYFAVSGLITAGYIALFVGTLSTLVNWAYHSGDTAVRRDCYALIGYVDSQGQQVQGLFEKVKASLADCDENFIAPPGYQQYVSVGDPELYQPLYSKLPSYTPVDVEPSAPPKGA